MPVHLSPEAFKCFQDWVQQDNPQAAAGFGLLVFSQVDKPFESGLFRWHKPCFFQARLHARVRCWPLDPVTAKLPGTVWDGLLPSANQVSVVVRNPIQTMVVFLKVPEILKNGQLPFSVS